MHKKVYVAPTNEVIRVGAVELMATSGDISVSDKETNDDANMSNIDRNPAGGNLWEQGW